MFGNSVDNDLIDVESFGLGSQEFKLAYHLDTVASGPPRTNEFGKRL